MLTQNTTEISRVPKESAMLEFRTREEISALDRPRVLNTHFLSEAMPKDTEKEGVKVVFVMRNPKDVLVSAFHHFSKESGKDGSPFPTIEEFKKLFLSPQGRYKCHQC